MKNVFVLNFRNLCINLDGVVSKDAVLKRVQIHKEAILYAHRHKTLHKHISSFQKPLKSKLFLYFRRDDFEKRLGESLGTVAVQDM